MLRWLLPLILVLGVGLLPAGTTVHAMSATDTVTSCSADPAVSGSLPYDVANAAAGDTITFALDCPSTSPIALTTWIVPRVMPLTVDGSGHQIDIDGGGAASAFHVLGGNTLTLRDLTISNAGGTVLGTTQCSNASGTCTLHAAAVYSEGTLTVTGCTFSSDSGHMAFNGSNPSDMSDGAAIDVPLGQTEGSLTVISSYFQHNGNAVGVIYSAASSTTITSSTFDSNGSASGVNYAGSIEYTVSVQGFNGSFTNDTFISNFDSYTVDLQHDATVIASTFDNADSGAFTSNFAAYVSIGSSILNAGCLYTGAGTTDLGDNLDTTGEWFSYCGFSSSRGDKYASSAGLAGAAAHNGGTVPTDAVESGSAAIGMVPPGRLCPATDARNFARPGAGETNCTAGAYEYNGVPPATATTLTSSANPSVTEQQVTFRATVSPVPDGGTVAFKDGSITISGCGSQAVNTTTGTATCQVTYSTTGSHTITAVYSGDSSYAGSSSSSLSQTVGNPTAALVSRFTVRSTAHGPSFRWRMATNRGVAGFSLTAAGQRLTPHNLAPHASRDYRYTAHLVLHGPYSLTVYFVNGGTAQVTAH